MITIGAPSSATTTPYSPPQEEEVLTEARKTQKGVKASITGTAFTIATVAYKYRLGEIIVREIVGFCFYHYWAPRGDSLLDQIAQYFIANSSREFAIKIISTPVLGVSIGTIATIANALFLALIIIKVSAVVYNIFLAKNAESRVDISPIGAMKTLIKKLVLV